MQDFDKSLVWKPKNLIQKIKEEHRANPKVLELYTVSCDCKVKSWLDSLVGRSNRDCIGHEFTFHTSQISLSAPYIKDVA